ncbi:hypothetical protein C8R44DRAFT_875750 [Mycena epipterygia]|nr:hypothetical protein C8R44DRAFT_875750 [Mycena epipterygia]
MSSAKDVVISTPELLELILARLPMRKLLTTAPLVSKMWKAHTLSPALQRALFFQPDPSSERIQNPLLLELFSRFFGPKGPNRWSWPGEASTIMVMPWAKTPDAFKRADASWRRMLVQQPTAQTMTITETCHGQGGYNSERRAVLNDLSLRMGVLYDMAVPFIDRVASSFCINTGTTISIARAISLSWSFTQSSVVRGDEGSSTNGWIVMEQTWWNGIKSEENMNWATLYWISMKERARKGTYATSDEDPWK